MSPLKEVPSNAKCRCGHDAFYHRRADGICLYKDPGGYQCGCFQFTHTGSSGTAVTKERQMTRYPGDSDAKKDDGMAAAIFGLLFVVGLMTAPFWWHSVFPMTR